METFIQPKITGYRQLSEEEAALINRIKAQGEVLEGLINALHNNDEVEIRWVNIGQTQLQLGLMALVRAIARPTSF